jgi:hypothetical protein
MTKYQGQKIQFDGYYDHAREVLVGPRSAPTQENKAQGMATNPQGYFVITPLMLKSGCVRPCDLLCPVFSCCCFFVFVFVLFCFVLFISSSFVALHFMCCIIDFFLTEVINLLLRYFDTTYMYMMM